MSATEQIRVSPEVKSALEAEKEPGESYNETLERLIDERVARRRKAIREGAGVWEGTDGAEAARQIHEEMNEGLSPDP